MNCPKCKNEMVKTKKNYMLTHPDRLERKENQNVHECKSCGEILIPSNQTVNLSRIKKS